MKIATKAPRSNYKRAFAHLFAGDLPEDRRDKFRLRGRDSHFASLVKL